MFEPCSSDNAFENGTYSKNEKERYIHFDNMF